MKFWFFRTPRDVFGMSALKPDESVYTEIDTVRSPLPRNTIYLGRNRPAECPDIPPGECVPVELVPVKAKKKARKG